MEYIDGFTMMYLLKNISEITIEDLADYLDISVTTVNRYLSQDGRPKFPKSSLSQDVVCQTFNRIRKASYKDNTGGFVTELLTLLKNDLGVSTIASELQELYTAKLQEVGEESACNILLDDLFIKCKKKYTCSTSTAIPSNDVTYVRQGETGIARNRAVPSQYDDLKKIGYTAISIAERLVENDMELYGSIFQSKAITPENEGSTLQWAEFLSSYPETFQYLVNSERKIIGNFSFLSITDEMMEEYLQGQLFEQDFTPSNTRDLFSAGRDHILFLLNLSINDEYSTLENNTILRKLFLDELISLAKNDVIFKKIITNVYKSSQEAFYKQWGFRYVKDHPLSGKIYELDMIPYPAALDNQLSNNSRLSEANKRLKSYYEREN